MEESRPGKGLNGSVGRLGRVSVRPLLVPPTAPRTHIHHCPEPLSEVVVRRPGTAPVHRVVPSREVTEELLERLEAEIEDLPRLPLSREEGAVDLKLEAPDGSQVKSGTIVLEGPRGKVAVAIDPSTRRFRSGELAPGVYQVHAASAEAGRGALRLDVRPGDVTRAAVRLDGEALRGTATVRMALRGTRARRVNVRATDRSTGRVVFEGAVEVERGEIVVTDVPFGRLHWDVDDEDARSCYDTDVSDLVEIFREPLRVELIPKLPVEPDPPDWLVLPRDFASLVQVLPELGVRSLEELAAAEPEGLMHRAKDLESRGLLPVHSRLFADAIDAARKSLGLRGQEGEERRELRLGPGATFTRTVLPRAAGEVELAVDLGPGGQAELVVEGPGGTERRSITGSERVRFQAAPEDVAAGRGFRVSLTSRSEATLAGSVLTRLPAERFAGFTARQPTVKQQIESIMESLAVANPGLSAVIPSAVMAPENIQMWLDRARTLMDAAGVCSMADLGKFRLQPMPVLRPGAYVAPVVQPSSPLAVPALRNYAFSHVLASSVLFYRPNDVLHETAVVMAGEWDLRGQTIVIGKEVRELVVIVGSIRHDGGSRFTWEMPVLPAASSYWPSPAPHGANGSGWGAHGQDGGDGDPDPHPSINGGPSAATPAPIVTFYLRDGTGNLPPLDLRGQMGGGGGRGQDGGRGGNGECGLRADGTVFGGCCRGVGWGGNGGRGGDGGRGGRGGRGGDGGRVTILTTAPGIAVLAAAPPAIDVNPGIGGPGGVPGSPADGGAGGPAGTADCEPWCDEHPERRGSNGAGGTIGSFGFQGDGGPAVLPDAIQILPITDEQWVEEFNRPHILDLNPDEVEPGATVHVTGQNFDPANDRVFYDGFNVGPVDSATHAVFTVPLTAEGGWHPVVIRPAGPTSRRSNRAMLHVLPRLDAIAPATRWVEGTNVTLTGLAFLNGAQVIAEDRSTSPVTKFTLPVTSVTRTEIRLQIPGAPLGNLRGVRRIVVRNPDNGESRAERIARISDTIVVRCAAFRVVGTTPGIGTARSAAEITALFNEGAAGALSVPWAQARIVFKLVQPVQTVTIADDLAFLWPQDEDAGVQSAGDRDLYDANGGVPGALNLFFFRDVEESTAYAWIGEGLIMMGDEGNTVLGPVDFMQVVAHEIGHALCLRHVCAKPGEDAAVTFFGRSCQDGDEVNLMYPYWNVSDLMLLLPGQVDAARIGATHVESGKTSLSHPFDINRCGAVDNQS
jgi:hypothetical protein